MREGASGQAIGSATNEPALTLFFFLTRHISFFVCLRCSFRSLSDDVGHAPAAALRLDDGMRQPRLLDVGAILLPSIRQLRGDVMRPVRRCCTRRSAPEPARELYSPSGLSSTVTIDFSLNTERMFFSKKCELSFV